MFEKCIVWMFNGALAGLVLGAFVLLILFLCSFKKKKSGPYSDDELRELLEQARKRRRAHE
jgi:hypothetical protein